MRFTLITFGLLLFAACASPFAGYEVPTMPEERIIKTVKKIMHGLERSNVGMIMAAYDPEFRSSRYDSGEWNPLKTTAGIESRKWVPTHKTRDLDIVGMREEWRAYLNAFPHIARAEAKPRIMNARGLKAYCTMYLDIKGLDADSRFRNDRYWVHFQLKKYGETVWKITSQEIRRGDSAVGRRVLFRDVARENGTVLPHNASPLFGPKEMAKQTFPLVVRGDSGLCAADFDGDGWTDLYYCDGIRNRLLRNRGDGTFEDVTKKAGLEVKQSISRSAIFFDADNDGDNDLFVTFEQAPCMFFENNGDGTFTNITEKSGLGYDGYPTSLSVADYDNDGLLDLYMGCYGDFYSQFPTIKTKNGDPNRLFRNTGGLVFDDVTEQTKVGDKGWTLACTWGDYDNDGDQDLLVCNDFGENSLYRNEGGWFSNVTYIAGVAVDGFGMSASFGDYDNDGDLDIYLAGMYSNAGQWVFNRKELLPVPEVMEYIRNKVFGMLDFMTDGNRLLRNEGNGKFTEVAKKAGVDYGQFGWCAPWIDIDNDGDLDLYGNNGFWTGPDPDDL